MRLAAFIQSDMDRILAKWEAFAATRLPAAGYMQPLELRDHAEEILDAIAADLSTPQTREEQAAKSMGLAPPPFEAAETAAQTHAVLRARAGFNIKQLASEYRSLRASVLGLWMEACPREELPLDDVIRFNEAIDQALAESIAHFSAVLERSRNLLLGMLGHDMRNPLQTIRMTAVHLAKLNAGEDVSQAATRLINSGAQMQSLLDDLLDFNRTQLGLGINVAPHDVDLKELLAVEVDLLRAAHPERRIDFEVVGDCRGSWDSGRLRQVLDNLVGNALAYGAKDGLINVKLIGTPGSVQIEITNQGQVIAPAVLARLFQPLQRGEAASARYDRGLGLGLYIASEIAKAHGGEVEARSDATGTVFAVRLPRRSAAASAAP